MVVESGKMCGLGDESSQTEAVEEKPDSGEKTEDLIQNFIKDCEARLSPSTASYYADVLRSYERSLGEERPENASKRGVRRFLNDLKAKGRAKSTLGQYLSILKSFYSYVRDYHGVDCPDLRKMQANDYRREDWEGMGREALSRKEVRAIIEAPENLRDTLLIAMLYYTGLRASEIVNLKTDKLNTEKRIIEVVGKGNKRRKVWYPPKLDRLVRTWLKRERKSYANARGSDYLFVSKFGEKLTRRRVWEIVHEASEKAGIQETVGRKSDGRKCYRVKPHVLRHSFATHAAEDGVPIQHIQRIMGHRHLDTTMGYAKESEETILRSFFENFQGV